MNAVRELRAELDEVSRLSGDPRRDGFSALAETASDLADKAARRSVYARRLGMLAETLEELAGS
jgi:hypothetical protein